MKQTKTIIAVLAGALVIMCAVQGSAREAGSAVAKMTKLVRPLVTSVETYSANNGTVAPGFVQKPKWKLPELNECPKAAIQVSITDSVANIVGTPCHDHISILFDGAKNVIEAVVMNLKEEVVYTKQFELPSKVATVFADLKGGDDEFTYSVAGGRLNCTVAGDAGNDTILTSDGNDTLDGGEGDDTLEAGLGVNKITGGNGSDELYALDGSNAVYAIDGVKDNIFHGTNASNNSVESDEVDEEIFE